MNSHNHTRHRSLTFLLAVIHDVLLEVFRLTGNGCLILLNFRHSNHYYIDRYVHACSYLADFTHLYVVLEDYFLFAIAYYSNLKQSVGISY